MNDQLREQRPFREVYADYLLGPNAVRKAKEEGIAEGIRIGQRQVEESVEQFIREEHKRVAMRLIDLGHPQKMITEVYGPDIWTPELLDYLEKNAKSETT